MEDEAAEHVIIDRFVVPKAAMPDFRTRIALSMQIIAKQAGFVSNKSYEQVGHNDESTYITLVTWRSREDFEESLPCVQTEYERASYDPSKMMESLHIAFDRGIYTEVKSQRPVEGAGA